MKVLVVDHYDSYTWNLVHLIAAVTNTLPDVVEHDRLLSAEASRSRAEASDPRAEASDPRAEASRSRAEAPDPLPAALAGYSHIVLSPGPGHPAERSDFALGPDVFELGKPVLGVCLGMQALVQMYGGQVTRVAPAHGEVALIDHDGTGPFAGLPTPLKAVRYHSLAATSVPDVLRVNAMTDDVVMGVVHREKPLWGVQFHPESILSEQGRALIANFLELS